MTFTAATTVKGITNAVNMAEPLNGSPNKLAVIPAIKVATGPFKRIATTQARTPFTFLSITPKR